MTSLQTEIGDRCQQGRTGKSQWTAPTLGPGLVGKADKVQGLASCPHSGAGCAWRGAVSELPGHLATQVVAYSAI